MINETYSAFVQGFMPTLARPDVDVLDGLTPAIIVDQERMGANARSTVGTATDANAMLRILFSRLGKPHIGSPHAFSFNTATVSGAGAITIEKGGEKRTEKRTFSRAGGMCPRCEGMGAVTDFDLSALYDDSKSLSWSRRSMKAAGYVAAGVAARQPVPRCAHIESLTAASCPMACPDRRHGPPCPSYHRSPGPGYSGCRGPSSFHCLPYRETKQT